MNQQPDKLFREKLHSFQTPAPSGAWSRIEANLEKKNNKILWFRIAASLLLVALAAYLLWPLNDTTTPQPQLADKPKVEKNEKPQLNEEEEKKIETAPQTGNKIAKQETKQTNRAKQKPVESEKRTQHEEPVENKNALAENSTADNGNTQVVQESISDPVDTQTVVVASAETEKVKIIFSADEVDNKYLDKKALAEATSDDKKPSTLKKLLDKAYDLKYNQDPFGDLRQRKDEILALNFRKDKRSDNK